VWNNVPVKLKYYRSYQVHVMVAPKLKSRYINVYLPSEKVKQEWEEDAKNAGLTLSKFVFEAVEAFRTAKDDVPRFELANELAETKEEVQKLRSDLKLKNLLLEKLESDFYKARYADFAKVDADEGRRRHDEDLIMILKRGKAVEGFAILTELGIDPRETEAVKLVNNQLESLRRFGLVEETAEGWRWIR
jgi:hypothetical protein